MANQKPKKSGKKDNSQPEPKKDLKETTKSETTKAEKEVKDTKEVKETTSSTKETVKTVAASTCANPFKGFFARKYGENENILTIFKTPKIWGALLGEVIGTMLFVMLMLTLGFNPTFLWMGLICIYAVIVGLSGANLNPLVTAGMMATRRMSAIRGVLYMLAQLLGAWIGLIIVNGFRLGSGAASELPMMTEITGETFWAVALIELMGAIVIAFCFARALKYAKKSALTFSWIVTSAIVLAVIFATVLAQGFFSMQSSFMLNPVAALMYQILPTAADNFGELAQLASLAVAAYIIFPVIGGVVGFFLSDVVTRLAGEGYSCDYDTCDCVCKK